MSPAWFDHQKRGQASVSVRISNSVRTIHHLHCLTWERRRGEQGGSVWENRDDARSTGCNQGEMLHVAVVTQACIHVAVVIHTCLLLPPAMTLRDRKVSFQDHNRVQAWESESLWCSPTCPRAATHHTLTYGITDLPIKNTKMRTRVLDEVKTKLKLP